MGSALPRRTCHGVFCVGTRILGFGLFSAAPPLPKIHWLCILCFISDCSEHTVGMYDSEQIHMMVVGLPWDAQMALITSLLTRASHWEAARRAAKTPTSVAAAGHCRVLGGWQGFTTKHLFPWPWSSSLPETTNSMAREARKLLCEGPFQCPQHKTTTCSRQLPCTQGFSCGFMWQNSSTDLSFRRCISIFPGIMPQKAKGKAGPDAGRDISGSNRKSIHPVRDTLVLATRCHL